MKPSSARTSRAPAPTNTGKPEPDSFAPRFRSRIPSRSAISQCGAPPAATGVPHVRTTVVAEASPAGTSGSGRFGTNSAFASRTVSMLRSSASSVAICWP